MALTCISQKPRTPRHKEYILSHSAQEVVQYFQPEQDPTRSKTAEQAQAAAQDLAQTLDSPDFRRQVEAWIQSQPYHNQNHDELAQFAADALRRWHEYLTQCGGYQTGYR